MIEFDPKYILDAISADLSKFIKLSWVVGINSVKNVYPAKGIPYFPTFPLIVIWEMYRWSTDYDGIYEEIARSEWPTRLYHSLKKGGIGVLDLLISYKTVIGKITSYWWKNDIAALLSLLEGNTLVNKVLGDLEIPLLKHLIEICP